MFLRRQDVVAQALSWSRAIQTGHWHHWDPPPSAEPSYDFDRLDALVREANEHNDAWRRWFGENGIAPLELRYEDIADEPMRGVRQVLDLIGVPARCPALAARTIRLADARSREWAVRYRAEAAARRPA